MQKKKKNKKRKNRVWSVLSTILLMLAVMVFFWSAYELVSIYREYKDGTDQYARLAKLVPGEDKNGPDDETVDGSGDQSETQEEIERNRQLKAFYEEMAEANPDYQAWIVIEDTNINYPIVQAEDNDYYLHRLFDKTENFSGTLFIDCHIEQGIEDRNVIVYGHNMKNGSMFAGLKKFMDNSFYESHKTFQIYTKDGAVTYEIFAKYVTSPDSQTYTYGFGSDESFLRYINTVKGWSEVDTGVEVGADDRIITLSTCVNDNKDRYIVQAKRLK